MIPNLDWEDVAFLIKCLRSFLECNWLGLILEKPIICPFNLNEHSFILPLWASWPSPVAQLVKNPPATWETWVRSLGWEDPLEEAMATHSRFLPGESPWTEEPGGLQSMGSQSQEPLNN